MPRMHEWKTNEEEEEMPRMHEWKTRMKTRIEEGGNATNARIEDTNEDTN